MQHGPFVATSREGIQKAFLDYQMQKNGFEGAHSWRSEIGKRVRSPLPPQTATTRAADASLDYLADDLNCSRRRWQSNSLKALAHLSPSLPFSSLSLIPLPFLLIRKHCNTARDLLILPPREIPESPAPRLPLSCSLRRTSTSSHQPPCTRTGIAHRAPLTRARPHRSSLVGRLSRALLPPRSSSSHLPHTRLVERTQDL